ncbi:MAG: methionyl-tRNA formyltransferase, partial [Micropepsaceae bacterium]
MTLRLAFMGTPDFAVPTLAELIGAGHEIACVYTRAPRPKGRGMAEGKSPVHVFTESPNIPVRTPATLKSDEEDNAFAALKLDAAIIVAYGLILPKAILDAPRLGCFNLHASLLPRWRGAAPIQRAIMAGDAETGIMVMRMEEGLDTGPILMSEKVDIGRKTAGALHDELAQLGANLMARALLSMESGAIDEQPQDEAGASYARKISRNETKLDWSCSAVELDRKIRGLSPYPGAWFEAKNERIKVKLAEPVVGSGVPGCGSAAPGEILPDRSIACGEGALK